MSTKRILIIGFVVLTIVSIYYDGHKTSDSNASAAKTIEAPGPPYIPMTEGNEPDIVQFAAKIQDKAEAFPEQWYLGTYKSVTEDPQFPHPDNYLWLDINGIAVLYPLHQVISTGRYDVGEDTIDISWATGPKAKTNEEYRVEKYSLVNPAGSNYVRQ